MSQIQPQTQALAVQSHETKQQLTLAEAGDRAANQRTWTLVGVLDARTAATVTRPLRKGWPAREGRLTLDLTGLTAIDSVGTATLVDVWQHRFDERRPLQNQDLGLVVRAMSEMLHEQIQAMLPQMDDATAGRPIRQLHEDRTLPAPPTPMAAPVRQTRADAKAQVLVARQELAEARRVYEAGAQFNGSNGRRSNSGRSAICAATICNYASTPSTASAGEGVPRSGGGEGAGLMENDACRKRLTL